MANMFRTNSAFATGIAAALAVAFAAPALAKSGPAPTVETKDGSKICIAAAAGSASGEVTGSIMKRKICRSKAKWLADGVTFDEKGAAVAANTRH